jgi:hypothetical protein
MICPFVSKRLPRAHDGAKRRRSVVPKAGRALYLLPGPLSGNGSNPSGSSREYITPGCGTRTITPPDALSVSERVFGEFIELLGWKRRVRLGSLWQTGTHLKQARPRLLNLAALFADPHNDVALLLELPDSGEREVHRINPLTARH